MTPEVKNWYDKFLAFLDQNNFNKSDINLVKELTSEDMKDANIVFSNSIDKLDDDEVTFLYNQFQSGKLILKGKYLVSENNEIKKGNDSFDEINRLVNKRDAEVYKESLNSFSAIENDINVSNNTYGAESPLYSKKQIKAKLDSLDNSDYIKKDSNLRKQIERRKDTPNFDNSFEKHMEDALTKFDALKVKLNDYTNNIERLYARDGKIETEGTLVNEILNSFSDLQEELDKCMLYKASDSRDFRKFNEELYVLKKDIQSMSKGDLYVPNIFEEIRSGNEVRRKNIYHLKEVTDDNGNTKIVKKYIQPDYKNGEKMNFIKSDAPLFSHDPSPDDVNQGYLGNCYLMASLAAVASYDPDIIRSIMKENEDGTVTVRFFDNFNTPMYVTVDKSIPVLPNSTDDAFAKGALWVKLIEKAYAISGLGASDGEIPTYTYSDIANGTSPRFLSSLLGGMHGNANVFSSKNTMPKPDPNKVDTDHPYKKDELDFYDMLLKKRDAGNFITAGSLVSNDKKDTGYIENNGIPKNHEYSVIGFEEHNGLKYIKVRNPHVKGVRKYDNDQNPYYDDNIENNRGESLVELRDFCRSFSDCYTFNNTLTKMSKVNNIKGIEFKKLYGDVLNKICKAIKDNDNKLLHLGANSTEYNKLAANSDTLLSLLKQDPLNESKLKKEVKDMFKNAKDYINYRDHDKKTLKEKKKDRSVNRYLVASELLELEKAFNINETKFMEEQEKVNYEDINRRALFKKENPSEARRVLEEKFNSKELPKIKNVLIENINDIRTGSIENIKEGLENKNIDQVNENISTLIYINDINNKVNDLSDDETSILITTNTIDKATEKLEPITNEVLKETKISEINNLVSSDDPKKIEEFVNDYKEKVNNLNSKEVEHNIEKDSKDIIIDMN